VFCVVERYDLTDIKRRLLLLLLLRSLFLPWWRNTRWILKYIATLDVLFPSQMLVPHPPDCLHGLRLFLSDSFTYPPSIPPGSVTEYQLWLRRQKGSMVHSVSGWMRGVQVKLWNPSRTHAIPLPEYLKRCVHDEALYKSTFTYHTLSVFCFSIYYYVSLYFMSCVSVQPFESVITQ